MTRKLLFFSLIFLFISCTVTKRVHRPGYHIQWRKIERTQSKKEQAQVVSEERTKSLNQENTSQLAKGNPVDSIDDLHLELSNEQEIILTVSSKPEKSKSNILRSSLIQKSIFEKALSKKYKRAQSSSQKSTPPIFWRMSARTLKIIGIVLMCIGAMFLFASLLVQLGAFSGNATDGNGGTPWLDFFLDLILITDWFWLLIFIVVFVLIAYLFFLLVKNALGGPVIGTIVGLAFLAIGIFFFALGKNREIEP